MGLTKIPKHIPSKYFYDKNGDNLFIQIMNMPEYFLTRAEHEIFRERTKKIIKSLRINNENYFGLIELGAGDATKTKELLKVLVYKGFDFDYFPIDISKNALEQLVKSLAMEIPKLQVQTRQGDYFEVLTGFKELVYQKIVLFLGSNLGNLSDDNAARFIYQLGSNLKSNDRLLLGVDLIKPTEIVLPAYNDAAGITSRFNLNLLTRINRELNADFDIEKFRHIAQNDEKTGFARSFLESLAHQQVTIGKSNNTYHFVEGEYIQTEISRKYNDTIINSIIADTDFVIETKIMDSKHYFANYILKRE